MEERCKEKQKSEERKVKSKASEYLELGMWVKNEERKVLRCNKLRLYCLHSRGVKVDNQKEVNIRE